MMSMFRLGRGCLVLAICLFMVLSACRPAAQPGPGDSLALASFSRNQVEVQILLEVDSAGLAWLTGIFTPLEAGAHLYALDLPRRGVDGVGRPTLLELPPASPVQPLGPLTASLAATAQDPSQPDLRTYPPGPVTLRLPIALPPGNDWVETQVSVTYMACKGNTCRPPVENGLIAVRIPGAAMVLPP
jgi:hypothetical protein